MLNARGYTIPERFHYLLDQASNDRAKFEQFNTTERPGIGRYYFSDVFLLRASDESPSRELTSIVCEAKHAIKIVDEIITAKVISAGEASRVDLQLITTNVTEEYFPNNPMVQLEIVPYQLLYIDATTHVRASGWSVILRGEERQSVKDSYRVAKVSFQRISLMDPLSLQLGARPGDIIRICSNNINSGLLSSRILYREVS